MIAEFVEDLRDLQDSAAFERAMADMVSELGFERFAYAALYMDDTNFRKEIIVNYPLAWVSHYIDEDYLSYDPVIKHAHSNFSPFTWHDVHTKSNLTKKQKKILNEGVEFGLRHGATVPLHLPGGSVAVLSVTSPESEKAFRELWREHAFRLQAVALYFHSAIEHNLADSNLYNEECLTSHEKEVLVWIARNKSIGDISYKTEMSVHEVCQYLQRAMKKLRTQTKQHAVIKAITAGYIVP
jgi:DNA-binding CsgD family transcriptional regulator